MVKLLVAYNRKRVIGVRNGLPWHLPEDMKLFKQRTLGGAVVMGRKTYESIPEKFRPLVGRLNVVLTRTPVGENVQPGPVFFIHISRAVDYAQIAVTRESNPHVYVIGGEQIYREALKEGFVDEVIASEVDGDQDGDAFFPELGPEWEAGEREPHEGFTVVHYRRKLNA